MEGEKKNPAGVVVWPFFRRYIIRVDFSALRYVFAVAYSRRRFFFLSFVGCM